MYRFCLVHGVYPEIIHRNGQIWFDCCWREHLEKENHVECPNCHKEIFIDTAMCPKCGSKLPYRAGQYCSIFPITPKSWKKENA